MDFPILSFPLPILIFLLHFIIWRIWKKFKTSNNKLLNLPPGPWKLPIIGNLHQLIGGGLPHHKLTGLVDKYGPAMLLQVGEVPTVVVSSPETARQVLKTLDSLFAQKSSLMVGDIVFYKSADIFFAPCGDRWRQLRKICITELLGLKRVKLFRKIREEEVSNLVSCISSSAGSPVNLSKMLHSLSTCIIGRAAFGKKSKDQEAFVPVAEEVLKMAAAGFNVADWFPSMKWLHVVGGIQNRLEKLHVKVDLVLEKIINEHRISRAMEKGDNQSEDIVHALLDLQEHGNLELPLTSDNIKAVILNMFLGGIDTSAAVIEWAMSEIIKNPKVMLKAQVEVREVLNGKTNFDETSINELKYLKLVIKETLRLHPPCPLLFPKESSKHCQINGYDIPAKTRVIVNTWALGRDPNYWIEPEKFCPERFLDCSIDYKGNSFEFIPFGAGKRICPGILFGIATVELVLAKLLYCFDWELPNGEKNQDLDMTEGFALAARKNHLYLIPVLYQQNSY